MISEVDIVRTCGKIPYRQKQAAHRATLRHKRALCHQCMSGVYEWRKYPCTETGTKHWHTGHRRREQ